MLLYISFYISFIYKTSGVGTNVDRRRRHHFNYQRASQPLPRVVSTIHSNAWLFFFKLGAISYLDFGMMKEQWMVGGIVHR